MVTLKAEKGLSADPKSTPQPYLEKFAQGRAHKPLLRPHSFVIRVPRLLRNWDRERATGRESSLE